MDKPLLAKKWSDRLADLPMVVMALGLMVLLYGTVSTRWLYPYDLEWMEGGMLAHAARVASGEPLYVLPSVEFIPFIYPPMYPWIVGGLSALGIPLDYALGRSVSIISVGLAATALVGIIRREGGGWALAGATAALFLGTYENGGAFFDLNRAHLCIFLLEQS